MALEGSLKEFNLADILQLLYFQKKTGALILQGRFDRVRLLFYEGNIVGAESKRRDADNRLGRVLLKRGLITQENIDTIVQRQKKESGKFGALLVRAGFVSKEDIQEVITFQITETMVQLFSWKEGRYEFIAQSIPLDKEVGVELNTEHFLMEGVRLVDEWSEIKDRISVDSVFAARRGVTAELSPEEEKILRHVDGDNDVGTIADITGVDSFTVSMTLLGLMEKGLVSRREEREFEDEEAATPRRQARRIPGLTLVIYMLVIAAMVASVYAASLTAGSLDLFKARNQIDRLRLEIETYKYREGSYPVQINDTDQWGNPYIYEPGTGSFTLESAGPDGRAGTEDDVF